MAVNTLKSVKINLSGDKPIAQAKSFNMPLARPEPNLIQQALETQSKMDFFTRTVEEVPLSNSRGASIQ